MITFDQAKTIAAAALLPDWNQNAGTFYIADWGLESDQYWSITAGALEWLEFRDDAFVSLDDTLFLVDKTTGEFIRTITYNNLEILDQMTPYGDIPKDFQ